jgi:hypothetical protein
MPPRRDPLARVGGFDERLEAAEGLDLVLKLAAETDLHPCPGRRGFRRRPRGGRPGRRGAVDGAVLERHLADWATAQHAAEDRRLSIVLHAGTDLDRTAVPHPSRVPTRRGARRRRRTDRGPSSCRCDAAGSLPAHPAPHPFWARIGATVATNLGVAATTGEVVVPAPPPPRRAMCSAAGDGAGRGRRRPGPTAPRGRAGLVVSAGAVSGPGRTHPERSYRPSAGDAPAFLKRRAGAAAPIVPPGRTLLRLCGFDARAGDALPEVESHPDGRPVAGRTVVTPHAPWCSRPASWRVWTPGGACSALQELGPVPRRRL